MAVQYALIIKTRAGVTKRVMTGQGGGFRWISYRKELNAAGMLMFDLAADHNAIADLEQDGQVEVWVKDSAAGLDWYLDFEALFVNELRSADDDGSATFRAECPGTMDFLRREYVLWYANTANRSAFSAAKAETVLKTLVTYNITASASTANGRLFTTDFSNISVQADGAGGNNVTFNCAEQNLLEALQAVARIGDRDFWLTRTAAQTWEFRTAQYLGTDRSTTVTFALNFGNMGHPVLNRNRLGEITVVVAGGQGTETARAFRRRTGTNYNATYNSKVLFYSATQYTTNAGLDAAADVRLDELRAKDDLRWDAIQTPGCTYRIHYFHGDLVQGYFQGVTAVKQIITVSVTYAPSNQRPEVIQIETASI